MKMNELDKVMASAYLSAMILSSFSQAHSGIVLASGDPAASQKALSSMIPGLNAVGRAAVTQDVKTAMPASKPVAYAAGSVNADLPLSAEQLARLRPRAMANPENGAIGTSVTKLLGLGEQPIPVKRLSAKKGTHYVNH